RGARGVTLTEDGRTFRARAAVALEQLDDAVRGARSMRDEPRGTLRFTAPVDMGGLLAPVVARYASLYPNVRVEAHLTQSRLDFDVERLDVALRAGLALEDSALVGRRVCDLGLALVASPGYLAEHGALTDPRELATRRLVSMRFRDRGLTLTLRSAITGEETRFDPDPTIAAADSMFVREVALCGGGIAGLPSVLVARDLAAGTLVRVLPDHAVVERGALFLLHARTPFLPARTRAFRDLVIELLGPREASASMVG
ncbi:MAG: substrate binding domain-containing protein, partial [Deltaproteobacteria bacterium]|nr:substrate binding domain-containing protein [Deltaproteobacteria bacterium]